jgi:phosphoglycerol transferase MdoB-like AlkP superfamily enzyme
MYNLLFDKLSNISKPFISFSFTSTTHTPFVSPGKRWEAYPHNNTNLFGYLNTLKYADDKLGKFIQRCEKEPWFDNTIFVMMADHTIGFGDDSGMFEGTNINIKSRELENMRIPLVIYAPKIFKPNTFNTIGSQADMLPTLIDILGFKDSFSSLSNSLFSSAENRFALFKQGSMLGMVDDSGYIIHTLDKPLENSGDKSIEIKLKSAYQSSTKLLRTNRWYSNDK